MTVEQKKKDARCNSCNRARRRKYRAKERAKPTWKDQRYFERLKHDFGLSSKEHEALVKKYNGLCAICRQSETSKRFKRLSVDHDHSSGVVRGLLCNKCNTGLGHFRDDPTLLLRAIEYLIKSAYIVHPVKEGQSNDGTETGAHARADDDGFANWAEGR